MKGIKPIIPVIIICICLISLEVFLEYWGLPTKKTNVENIAISSSAVSEDDETYEPGLEWVVDEDFSFEKMNVNVEKINTLPVYDMACNGDVNKLFSNVGKFLWGNEVTKAKFTDDEYKGLKGEKYHDYTLQVEDKDGKRSLTGVTSWFGYQDDRQSGKKDSDKDKQYTTEDEQVNYVQKFVEQNRLGIWKEDNCFSEIKSYGKNQIRILSNFDGIPCTEYHYQNALDGKEYINDTVGRFSFGVTGDLRKIEELSSYELTGDRKIQKQYSDVEDLNGYLEKTEKKLKRYLNTQINGAGIDNPLFERYLIKNARICYCFIEKKDSTEGHVCAVPILELSGELFTCYTKSNEKFHSSVSVGINLDTGDLIGSTTQK